MKQKIKMFSSKYLKLLDMILNESRLPNELPNDELTENDQKYFKKAVIDNISKAMNSNLSGYNRALLKNKGELIHKLYYHGLKRNQIKFMKLHVIINEEKIDKSTPIGKLKLV